ncbi:transmembrane protein, putative [Medicago truncatula]|uniref:Transmembrane protein, putative n=1 Tax=Medicago truncatula TaxID=3880 RepID=A0A072V8S4_MEDTR|nr:transmembrane protein, putative [Medicago truncatula]
MTRCPLMEDTIEVGPIPSWQFLRHTRRWSGLDKLPPKQIGEQHSIFHGNQIKLWLSRSLLSRLLLILLKLGLIAWILNNIGDGPKGGNRHFYIRVIEGPDIIFNQLLNFFLQRIALLSVMTLRPLMEYTVEVRAIPRWQRIRHPRRWQGLNKQGKLKVQHVCTVDQLADCLTKPLSKSRHQLLWNKIGVTDGTPILRGRVRPTTK